jgi:hypothetical protein
MPKMLASNSLRVQTVECAGESRLRGSRASLNSNCQKTGESNHLQRSGILHATSSSTLSNSTNESVTWQAAKFGRRRRILELAHPPPALKGAYSLTIHNVLLLKSGASRQEKTSTCNRNGASTDEHFCDDIVFDCGAHMDATGTKHLDSLLQDDLLSVRDEAVTHEVGDGAA